jgi:hypothetical protein
MRLNAKTKINQELNKLIQPAANEIIPKTTTLVEFILRGYIASAALHRMQL